MANKRVEFKLTMPGRGSWNGEWSGDGDLYLTWRSLSQKVINDLKLNTGTQVWRYSWGDGWTAQVSARVMEAGERKRKSSGFCGYEWMVDNILDHGSCYDGRKENNPC